MVEQSLDLKYRATKAHYYLKWGSFNVIVLAFLMFDISNKCPYAESNWYYVEYAAATIVGLSMLACFLKYFLYVFHTQPVQGTRQQKSLMKFDDNGLCLISPQEILKSTGINSYFSVTDNSFITTTPSKKKEAFDTSFQNQYVNNTILSWHSSFNECKYFFLILCILLSIVIYLHNL